MTPDRERTLEEAWQSGPKVQEARRALRLLLLEAPELVVRDVRSRVEEAFREIAALASPAQEPAPSAEAEEVAGDARQACSNGSPIGCTEPLFDDDGVGYCVTCGLCAAGRVEGKTPSMRAAADRAPFPTTIRTCFPDDPYCIWPDCKEKCAEDQAKAWRHGAGEPKKRGSSYRILRRSTKEIALLAEQSASAICFGDKEWSHIKGQNLDRKACLSISFDDIVGAVAAALRRYAGDGGVTDEMVEAACKVAHSAVWHYWATAQKWQADQKRALMRLALEAAARAKSGEKGGAQ